MNLPNQETPLSYDLIPLFAIDLWEHAYYLKYRNNRNTYIENIWNKVNFDNASDIYKKFILKINSHIYLYRRRYHEKK